MSPARRKTEAIAPCIDYANLIKRLKLPPGFTAPPLLRHEDLEGQGDHAR